MMPGSPMRHLLTGTELTSDDLHAILDRAAALKLAPRSSDVLDGRTVALIFQKPSTRTRVSFEAGIVEMGGHPMVMRAGDLQLGRGESLRDTARVLGRHVAAVGVRTHADSELEGLAAEDQLPVFNMLTQNAHPCQVLADLLTLREAFGALEGLKLVYVGDGNNMARSLYDMGSDRRARGRAVHAAGVLARRRRRPSTTRARRSPARSAIYTDVWVSMGDEDTADARRAALGPYRIDDALLDAAAPGAVALHCLPAHPGEEITESVLYGHRQRIWDQAENRRHAQKAMLEWLLGALSALAPAGTGAGRIAGGSVCGFRRAARVARCWTRVGMSHAPGTWCIARTCANPLRVCG